VSVVAEADRYLTPNYARFPVEFVRGEGARLWDSEGVEYLDFLCGISVSSVGHCHPAVVAAIHDQAARLIHVGNLYYTEPMTTLAARLAECSLGGKVFFTNSGTETVEAALKCARKARQGGTIVSLHGAFHGRTYGSLSATPQESKQAPFAPLVGGFVSVAATIEALRAAVDERTAAIILEPIQGETGVHVLPDELLRAARELCDAVGATLIFDEIQTGLGRTGTRWAYEQSGVVPDLLCTAKALGGGLPIGALITGERHAVVCAAAHAALDVLLDEALLERVRALGELLRAGLAPFRHVTAVRGRGLMVAFDLDVDAATVVRRLLVEQKLVVNATGAGTVRLLPPLVISEAEALAALDRIATILETAP
jgi:acetylornithine/succinyldiaminopimelate/putrescine aminotransferase